MALPKGWVVDGLANFVGKGTVSSYEEILKRTGLPVPEDISLLQGQYATPVEWSLQVASWLGATVGSPLGLLPILSNLYQAGLAKTQAYDTARVYEPSRLAPRDFVNLVFRRYITPETIDDWAKDLHDQGWSEERILAMREAARPLLGVGEIRDLFLRGELGDKKKGETEAILRLSSLGYTVGNATDLVKLFYFLPPPQDVIRMAAREVFEPELREKYRLDEDRPVEYLTWAAKVGITGEVAANYWAAHWELPSYTQIIEMWHRGYIGESDVDDFFVQLDMVPYWRELLKKIAFKPFTRVDVRRMFKLGVLNDEETLQAYKDLGYNDKKAGAMLEFTKVYTSPAEPTIKDEAKELTRGLILSMYREKVIDPGTATKYLGDIEYPTEFSTLIIALEDAKLAETETRERVKAINRGYDYGAITREEAVDRLGKLNLPAFQQEYYLYKLDLERAEKVRRPTIADFRSWFKSKIINIDEFKWELAVEGFHPYYIEKYVESSKK